MNLLVDIGNTRIKWALWGEDGFSRRSAASYDSYRLSESLTVKWAGLSMPQEVTVANVAGATVAAAVTERVERLWALQPEFVSADRELGGMTGGYRDSRQLGVDRWLALAAAWHKYRRPCCIADCGTALTLDLLDGSGRHLGGVIVPGARLLREALWRGIKALSPGLEAGAPVLSDSGRKAAVSSVTCERAVLQPGRDTGEAIERGSDYALAGAIGRFAAQVRGRCGDDTLVLLCGGDAGRLRPLLGEKVRFEPDLVLEGLALWARLRPRP